ncbi:DPP IV N-terminal domain-containing protein [Stenotrophomonas sp. LARHCG68]
MLRSRGIHHYARSLALGLACAGAPLLARADAPPAPDAAAFNRSLQLREQWMYLTQGLAGPATWTDARQYRYRRTAPGGFEFVSRSVGQAGAVPAFDQARLATALSPLLGRSVQALRLPFSDYTLEADGRALRAWVDGGWMRCELGDAYRCARWSAPEREPRPRGWGVVRDLSMPADDTPQRSPDGRYEAQVREGSVVLRQLADGQTRVLARDGAATDFYDPESIVWSPDSSRFVVLRVVPGFARQVTRVETAPRDQVQPRVRTQLYPKPGDPVDIDRPVIFEVAGGRRIDVPTALFDNAYEITPPQFRADGRTLAFRYTARGHQRVRLVEVDAQSGAARSVVEEASKTFVNSWWYRAEFHDVGNRGEQIVWMSERDGWNHLYMVDGRTGRLQQLTRGPWVVRQIVKVDEARRQVWFAANGREPGDPYLQHFYRVDFDGRNLQHMTPGDGWHEISLSPDMNHYVDTWSRLDQPNITELRDARDGHLLDTVERGDASALFAAGYRAPETFSAPGRDGSTPIFGLVVRPTRHDPARRYPVIESIYAGPHDSSVQKKFWPFDSQSSNERLIGLQALADLGFIVVEIDGMGTMNRSKAFHDVAWKNLGDAGFPDRIAWHKAMAARDPSYDISGGVGIYGASAGGQNALNALQFHPEFYTVAVAYNGCYDNRMDKLSWNEQWLGWPVDASYSRASGVDNAHRMQGKLLLIVGEQDENVDPASTYQVADALIRAGKDFDLLTVPGTGHGVGRSQEPVDYIQRRKFDFFVRHLRGLSTPDWNQQGTR